MRRAWTCRSKGSKRILRLRSTPWTGRISRTPRPESDQTRTALSSVPSEDAPIPNWLDAIAAPRCIECDRLLVAGGGTFCSSCDRRLPRWRRMDGCPRCGSPPLRRSIERDASSWNRADGCAGCLAEGSALHACHTLMRYQGPVRRWLPGFKNARGPFGPSVAIRRAIDHLAAELAWRVSLDTPVPPDLVASLPLHPRRRRRRGFNHVDPIAFRIARDLDRPFGPDALERIRDTPAQAGLVGRARRENVRGAFRATPRVGAAEVVWLVDDVLTTGSSLDAAADALLDAGVLEVRALTLAATMPARWATKRGAAYHPAPSIDR